MLETRPRWGLIAGDIDVSIACSIDVMESLRLNIEKKGVQL
jgi:hypothetical protein